MTSRKRRVVVMCLLSLPLMLAIPTCLILGVAKSNQSKFDRLHEGMTLEEASEVLGHDLENYVGTDISGVYKECHIDNTIGIFTIEEYSIDFGGNRLMRKECRKLPPSVIWTCTLYNVKKLVGIKW